jgi:mRNA-degrading endonuclease RelE of RelBE toxin-antitoxin system
MPWKLQVSKRARRELMAVSDADRSAISRMANDPSSEDVKKLQGGRGWRLRVGNWRVLLEFNTTSGVIEVARVLNRCDAYRD